MSMEQSDLEFDLVPIQTNLEGIEMLDEPMVVLPVEMEFQPIYAPAAVSQPTQVHLDPSEFSTDQKVERAIAAITRILKEKHPLAVAYSGGKDSSVMAALTLEAARRLKESGFDLPIILFTHANTGIENPAMNMVAMMEIERIRRYAEEQGLPVRVDIAHPSLNDSWAVRIISGRALPTFANSSTRDCSINWKLVPQQRQRKAVFKELKNAGEPVVLVGTRREESSGRATRMDERGELDTEIWEQPVLNNSGKVTRMEKRLSPLAHWTQEDVWVFLSELGSGDRTSYTDGKDLWDVYRDGGNSSCVVVSDDTMKANAKACGARFGCALCCAVGRDKSLEAMLESDEKYKYLIPLNRLQRFLVDTQYDMNRRSWLGRTIQDDGYLAIAPDSYSPAMQRELLAYALTVDRDEKYAAAKLGIQPRFQLVSLEQLLAIDAIWSIQGYHPRPFEALHIWEAVYEKHQSFVPPEVDSKTFDKKIPKPRWLYVGDWDSDPGFNPMYAGARHLMADFVGSTDTNGCMQNIELGDGRVVMGMETSDLFDVDSEGAAEFLTWEVMENQIHHKMATYSPGEAFRHYQMLGTMSTGKRHLGLIDDMLRRASWKERNGVFSMSTQELLFRSVGDVDRKEGLRCPEGQTTLREDYEAKINAEHDRREATRFRPN